MFTPTLTGKGVRMHLFTGAVGSSEFSKVSYKVAAVNPAEPDKRSTPAVVLGALGLMRNAYSSICGGC